MKKSNSREAFLERLFSPNLIFASNPSTILSKYPKRSKKLEEKVNMPGAKNLNKAFIKDGKMYLLRGAKPGQETGFYSKLYASKETIEIKGYNPYNVAYAQNLNGDTPFLSATTDVYTAASFGDRIYVLAIPVEDVYTFINNTLLCEEEYMIPDFISNEEIVASFKSLQFRKIFEFLRNTIGLDIIPEDIGTTLEELDNPDMERIDIFIHSNNSMDFLDPILKAQQEVIMNTKETVHDEIPTGGVMGVKELFKMRKNSDT